MNQKSLSQHEIEWKIYIFRLSLTNHYEILIQFTEIAQIIAALFVGHVAAFIYAQEEIHDLTTKVAALVLQLKRRMYAREKL